MDRERFRLRRMELRDVESAIRLSNAEGWNQTEADWKFLIGHPDHVCLLVECDEKIIGTTTAITYSNQVAWIGMVLVDKAFRRQGVSALLLTEILKKIESIPCIKLDATLDGQRVYNKFGFNVEYQILRMVNPSWSGLPVGDDESEAMLIQNEEIEKIVELDAMVFGANRKNLIEHLNSHNQPKGWMLKSNDDVTGFVLGRTGTRYQHIGPVSAPNISEAKILITSVLNQLRSQPVVVDVLGDKVELIQWLTSIGFSTQRTFIRMYRNENLFPGLVEKNYLICGPEFG